MGAEERMADHPHHRPSDRRVEEPQAVAAAGHVLDVGHTRVPANDERRQRGADIAARGLQALGQDDGVLDGQRGALGHVRRRRMGGVPDQDDATRRPRGRQRHQLDERIRELVLEDQARRNAICWSAFDD